MMLWMLHRLKSGIAISNMAKFQLKMNILIELLPVEILEQGRKCRGY